MKRNLFLLVLLAVVVWAAPSFADLSTVTESPNDTTVYEINNMTPGSSKSFLGTRLRGALQTGTTTRTQGSTQAADNSATYESASTSSVVVTTGASWGLSQRLEDGYAGQVVTYVLATDGGRDFYVSPRTTAGFTNVQLNDAKDSVSLKFDGTEWFVSGNNGAVIN